MGWVLATALGGSHGSQWGWDPKTDSGFNSRSSAKTITSAHLAPCVCMLLHAITGGLWGSCGVWSAFGGLLKLFVLFDNDFQSHWGSLGQSWSCLEGGLGKYRVSNKLLTGTLFGPPWGILELSGYLLERSWGSLGAPVGDDGALWAILGPIGDTLKLLRPSKNTKGEKATIVEWALGGPSAASSGSSGATLGRLGTVFGPLGNSLGQSWAVLG